MADRSYIDVDGVKWDSRYESEVYEAIKLLDPTVRKCEQGTSDTLTYSSNVKGGRCLACESSSVVQERTYTPDLFIRDPRGGDGDGGTFIEVKGYWKPHKRNLFRSVVKSNPDVNFILVFQRDGWVTKGKSKYSDYVARYLKSVECVVWNNKLKNPGAPLPWL